MQVNDQDKPKLRQFFIETIRVGVEDAGKEFTKDAEDEAARKFEAMKAEELSEVAIMAKAAKNVFGYKQQRPGG